jgi:hypothetical protein
LRQCFKQSSTKLGMTEYFSKQSFRVKLRLFKVGKNIFETLLQSTPPKKQGRRKEVDEKEKSKEMFKKHPPC